MRSHYKNDRDISSVHPVIPKPSKFLHMMIWILFCALLAGSCYFTEAIPRRNTGSLDFLVVGDFGGQGTAPYYTLGSKNVARAMGVTAAKIGSKFSIGLGDNFYENGVTSVTDPRFQTTFEVGAPILDK